MPHPDPEHSLITHCKVKLKKPASDEQSETKMTELSMSLTRALKPTQCSPCLWCAQVLDVHWRGNQLWGTIEILSTPSGLLLWELYSQVSCYSSSLSLSLYLPLPLSHKHFGSHGYLQAHWQLPAHWCFR